MLTIDRERSGAYRSSGRRTPVCTARRIGNRDRGGRRESRAGVPMERWTVPDSRRRPRRRGAFRERPCGRGVARNHHGRHRRRRLLPGRRIRRTVTAHHVNVRCAVDGDVVVSVAAAGSEVALWHLEPTFGPGDVDTTTREVASQYAGPRPGYSRLPGTRGRHHYCSVGGCCWACSRDPSAGGC
jgi:hypothetical protein